MRLKLTFLLLALNAALIGVIYYFDKVQSTRSLMGSASRTILNPEFVKGLDQIRIQSIQTNEPWELMKSGDDWLVSSPIEWKANPYAVQQLLFQLRRLSWESRFPVSDLATVGQSLDSYNLATPPIRIVLGNRDVSLVLSLGSPTEIGNRLYLMSPDGEFIYVVPRGLLDSLQRDLDDFLDRRVFSLSGEETRAIQIQDREASNVRVRMERGRDQWRFVSPIEAPADSDRVELFLADWEALEVDGFESGEQIPLAMDGTSIRLTLEGLSQRETLILTPPSSASGNQTFYYLGRREKYPAVFKVGAERVTGLRAVQEELRETQVLRNFNQGWTSLEIQFDNLEVRLQQLENGAWQVLHTDGDGQLRSQPTSQAAIDRMKQLFLTLEAERFINDAPSEADLARYGLNDPQRRVLIRTGSQEAVEFRIGGVYPEGEETLLYATTNRSDSVFLVRPYVLATLSLDPYTYRNRTIRSLPESARITRLDLVHRPSGVPVPLTSGEAVEEALLEFIRTTRVERYLNRPFTDPLKLDEISELPWTYRLEAGIQYSSEANGPSGTIQLFLSERLGGTTQYVGDPESNLVGTLPVELIELLDPYLSHYPEKPEEAPTEPEEVPENQEETDQETHSIP